MQRKGGFLVGCSFCNAGTSECPTECFQSKGTDVSVRFKWIDRTSAGMLVQVAQELEKVLRLTNNRTIKCVIGWVRHGF